MHGYRTTLALLIPLVFAGCAGDPLTRSIDNVAPALPESLDDAAARWDIPLEILAAIAETETGFQPVTPHEEFPGRPERIGLMGLPEAHLADAAALAGVTPAAARTDNAANIAAAAALLDSWGPSEARTEPGSWGPAVAEYSGLPSDDAASYVHDEVFGRIARGIALEELSLAPWQGAVNLAPPMQVLSNGAERSYALYRPSPNQSSRPSGTDPSMVIIHTCEGSYTGCWSWLANSSSGVSAHYVVKDDGTEVSQLVPENKKAWHIGAAYDCDLNGGTSCAQNGSSSNNFTIGIEHAGYASQTAWNAGLLDTSARLVCDITADHGIPRDSYHIVGHGQLQPYNRVDPGPNWPWADYLARVRSACGEDTASRDDEEEPNVGGTPPSNELPSLETLVIDSNNARNIPGRTEVSVSGNWASSQNVSGYFGSGYWWRRTGATSDAAEFRFLIDAAGCYEAEAWWPAANDRSTAAPFIALGPDGEELGRVSVDQSRNGGQWNNIGNYVFPSGWNTIALSRWTNNSGVVVADAVRIVPSTRCEAAVPLPPIQWTIDTDNSLNNGPYAVEFSADWRSSSATPGYFGSDYVFHDVAAYSDPLRFNFELEQPLTLRVEARWTSGANRSTTAPFVFLGDGDERLGQTTVDQTQNHATWVVLDTLDFPAGSNSVALSHWTNDGNVVVADAVRLTEIR